ncbi:MAG TPA: zinc ribbon domain-containing protein [Ktedonobacteraceae bacterium]
MQKCTNCGSDVPDTARYCGLCGHEPGRVSTIDKETTRSDAGNGQQPGDMAALSTRELVRSEASKNGKHADDVAVLSTQELAGSEEVEKVGEVGEVGVVTAGKSIAENEQQAEDVAGLDTQGLANGKEVDAIKTGRVEADNEQPAEDVAGLDTQGLGNGKEKAQVEGSAPGAIEAAEGVYVPAGFSEVDKVQTQGEPLQTGTDEEGDRVQVQAASPFVSPSPTPAPRVRRGSAVRWMMIAVVCVLVLAGIAGGLLFMQRSQGTATTVTPGVGSSPTVSNTVGSTPSGTTCPKKSLAASCITPVTGTTPVVGTKAVFNITLSGALQGPMTVTSMTRCGPTTSGTEYDLYFSGTNGGTIYNFVGRIPAYKGPADYNTGQISVVFAQQPLAATSVWGNTGNAPAKATINADMKSGTMDITLSGASNTLNISGNWVCAV